MHNVEKVAIDYILNFKKEFYRRMKEKEIVFKEGMNIEFKAHPISTGGIVFSFAVTNGIIKEKIYKSKRSLTRILKTYYSELLDDIDLINKAYSSISFIENETVIFKLTEDLKYYNSDAISCDVESIVNSIAKEVKENSKIKLKERISFLEKENEKLKKEIDIFTKKKEQKINKNNSILRNLFKSLKGCM